MCSDKPIEEPTAKTGRNSYPEGSDHSSGLYVFLKIGIARSGIDSGNVDYALNCLAFDQMTPARKAETVETLKLLVEKFETE